jgi:hypothetical protein
MEHWPQRQIERLHAAERALNLGQGLVRPYGACGIDLFGRQTGAQHVEAIEPGLLGDGIRLAREVERMIGDGLLEVPGHLAFAQDGTDGLADFSSPAQRIFLSCRPGLDLAQVGLGQRQRQIATALWRAAGQQVFEADAPSDRQRREDVAMRQRAADLEAAMADRSQRIPAQGRAQGLEALERQLGQVGERAVLDLAVFAVGFPQQIRGACVAVGEP